MTRRKSKNLAIKSKKGFFDFFVLLDYYLQGKHRNLYIYGAIVVVLIAPILDYILLPQRMSITVIFTHAYLILLIFSILAWAGKFKNEKNQWSFKRAFHRFKLYFFTIKDTFQTLLQKDQHNQWFIFGTFLIFAGFIFKALQNISELIRRPLETYTDRPLKGIVFFEQVTSIGFVLVIIGSIILITLNVLNKEYNLFRIFVQKKHRPHVMQLKIDNKLTIINSRDKLQISSLLASNPNPIFKATINALSLWHPSKMHLESEYEDDLLDFMTKKLRRNQLKVESQYIIKDEYEYGRVDLVVQDSIFIEMKKKVNNKEIENATGQLLKYQRILERSDVPIVLLIVDDNYEHIKNKTHKFIADYNAKHFQKMVGIVVIPKK